MSIETMTKLATVTVGAGGSATINFTNIPQTYTDLKLVISARTNVDNWNDNSIVRFNSDSGNSYSNRRANASGSTVESSSNTLQDGFYYLNFNGSTATSNTFCNNEVYIPKYTSGNQKSFSIDRAIENNNSNENLLSIIAGIWTGTAAITSISIAPFYGTLFSQHSTATLYGIKNVRTIAGNSVKATGGNISFDGTYVVHTFNTSGTFTPTTGLVADYLVVAGGGSGGGGTGCGGGGAGGYRTSIGGTPISLTAATGYAVTVGAGGASVATSQGNNGSNSVFATITSSGGGGGGSNYKSGNSNGNTGGSGGGGGGRNQAGVAQIGGSGNAGGYTPVEGYAGGARTSVNNTYTGGGGGGSSAVGQDNPNSTTAGNGGAGTANSITGTSVTYAGGGGGASDQTTTRSSGGVGGGGGGGANGNPIGISGSANTGGGGGGGGASSEAVGGAGGSGIVIIRYKA